jgi:2-oxoglutarate dehydrogenase E2 component (dihydrolipoamide succinyltransferase)
VLELETDKVTLEVVAPASGALKISTKPGTTVNIGEVVGAVDEKATPPAGGAKPVPPSPSPATRDGNGSAAANGKVAPAAVHGGDDVRATPLARKLADEHGVDLGSLHGTGAGGRIREQDVMSVVEAKAAKGGSGGAVAALPQPAPTAAPAQAAPGGVRREKMSPLRQRVAARLVEAQHNAAMLTTFNECDMSAVMAMRAQYKESFEKKHGVGLGFMSFFIKAVVNSLKAYPAVNASLVPAAAGGTDLEIEYHDSADIAVAVGTPKGLVVPVLRGCEQLSFAQIESGIKDLAVRARDGKLGLKDLQGGTFTITNGGIYGSLMSTPILNPPQTGILGMHAIKNRAVEHPAGTGQVAIRPMMYLALSYDHRLIDGAEAVQFLVAVKQGIEEPQRLMLAL